ncbi:hypothetical protein EVAR_19546_1 [Eumeta japonica]|uniref:Reverse transcriptase domain-containing protein n=1 Tax=Eumeta variegata TaxID=151549 RepID=A0A4C1UGI2_EUMVA|nr:hypothetical protein EVAR_19546_1 [Eumeta japonica]
MRHTLTGLTSAEMLRLYSYNVAIRDLFMCSYPHDLKEYECGLKMNELSAKCSSYADDQLVIAPSARELQAIISKIKESVKKRGMEVNDSKTNTKVFERRDFNHE